MFFRHALGYLIPILRLLVSIQVYSKSIIVFLMLVCFGMIFLQGIVLNLVCHFAMVIRVICVVKFREKGRQYM